jgi:hypothetical protein
MRYERLYLKVCNVHVPSEDKSDNTKDLFYEELDRIKPRIGNESLHEIINDNWLV